ncbi:MAG: hypothetical protein ACJ8NS_04780 [Chthoniobacterales bacterium]
MTAPLIRRLQKVLVITLLATALGSFLFLGQIGYYYYNARPREPHPEAGRIYSEHVKGIGGVAEVYLTRLEHLPYDYAIWIQSGSGLLAVVAFVLNHRWRVIHTPTYKAPKKFY